MFGSQRATKLSDLIDKINWTQIQVQHGSTISDKITVEFGQKKKDDPAINDVRVRIGEKVLESLGWRRGDKIVALFNPNDQLTFLLAKSDHGVGHKIARDIANPSAGRVSFRWSGDFPLRRMKTKAVEFEAYEGKLIFIVTSDDMK
jgi:hypothetical protein